MKFSSSAIFALSSCLLSLSDASGTLRMDIARTTVSSDQALKRRSSGAIPVNLQNQITGYYLNVTVGTPGQTIALHLDTGSSDLWFPSVDSEVCTNTTAPYPGMPAGCPGGSCESFTSFDVIKSACSCTALAQSATL